MAELLTSAQMRALEQAAIDSGDVTGLDLMERAGQGVVEAVFEEWPNLAAKPSRAVILCGPGNNGGDGFVIARLLKKLGWSVEVFLLGSADKLPPDAATNYERWVALGPVMPLDCKTFWLDPETTGADCLLVDALFGTGLSRGFDCNAVSWALLTSAISAHLDKATGDYPSARVVAIDVPSGLDADSGRFLLPDPPPKGFECAMANLTVTFHAPKRGHILAEGPSHCGKLVVKDIGLPLHLSPNTPAGGVPRLTKSPAQSVQKQTPDHKYSHGHALVLTGGMGRTGAARLAARGALRIGAGLVTLGAPGTAMMECAAQITALMLQRCDDADGLRQTLQDTRLNALCLGPGLGLDRARDLVPTALRAQHRPKVVLDADALTAYADDPGALFTMLHLGCVLTPHGGEFARLFPDIAAKLKAPPTKGPAYSKVDATLEAAKRAGCTVLFKGPDTVIADETGHCAINASTYDRAAPWLATAGSGDVLAGFITGLLARGFTPIQAAETAAWLHTECALEFGPGLIAEDLPETLPAVLSRPHV